jgi:hypothetical protein
VPEVSVNENSDARFGEHQIWTAGQGALMDSEPQASGMGKLPDDEFRLRIPAPNPGHRVAALLWA